MAETSYEYLEVNQPVEIAKKQFIPQPPQGRFRYALWKITACCNAILEDLECGSANYSQLEQSLNEVLKDASTIEPDSKQSIVGKQISEVKRVFKEWISEDVQDDIGIVLAQQESQQMIARRIQSFEKQYADALAEANVLNQSFCETSCPSSQSLC